MKFHLVLALLIASSLVEATLAADPTFPFLSISKETTIITEPLRSDGTPDYVAAINARYSKGVTPENNAFRGSFRSLE